MATLDKTTTRDRVTFDSLDDLIGSLDRHHDGDGSGISSYGWYGTESYGQALDLARDGWDAIRPRVDAVLDRIRDRIADRTTPTFDMKYDVSGQFVDVAAFMSGEPACMINPVPVPTRSSGKVVRIHYNTGAMAQVDPDDMVARGVTVLALIDALGVLGVNCELWAESTAKKGKKYATVLVRVKEAHESMDINRLMFVIGNPSYHRRLTFAVRETYRLAGMTRGGACESAALSCTEEVGADVVVAEAHSSKDTRIKDPDGWILGELARLGFDVD